MFDDIVNERKHEKDSCCDCGECESEPVNNTKSNISYNNAKIKSNNAPKPPIATIPVPVPASNGNPMDFDFAKAFMADCFNHDKGLKDLYSCIISSVIEDCFINNINPYDPTQRHNMSKMILEEIFR